MKKLFAVLLCLFVIFSLSDINAFAVSAKAAVLMNGQTGEILYEKNKEMRLSMASTTKIMTALLLCEGCDLGSTVTVSPQAVKTEGTSMGLREGDTLSCKDLLYGMMLSSGNDAANQAAITLGGSIESFVALMNGRAKELGLLNTSFATPSGLDAENHYTTALDLANLTRFALENEDFQKAAGTKSTTVTVNGKEKTLVNHNRLLRNYDDIIGVKTGFTKKSGRCLVSAAKKDGKYLICVTLCDGDDWADHRSLINDGYKVLTEKTEAPQGEVYIPTASGGSIKVILPQVSVYGKKDSEITFETELPPFLFSPVKKGEKVGEMRCYSEKRLIKTFALISQNGETEKDGTFKKLTALFKIMLYGLWE